MRHPDMNRLACTLLTLMLLCVLAPAAHAATRYAVANANWNVASTWSAASGGASGASIPVAGDTVFIGEAGARTVTIPAGYAAACTTLTIGNTAKVGASTLTLAAASASLTVSGVVTVNSANNNNTTNALNVNAGTLSVGGTFTLNGGVGNRLSALLISTGTATLSGDLGVANANSRVTFSGAGALKLAGNFANGGTFTASTGTVTYNGAGAQNVGAYTYNNLTINKASGTASLTANTPVAGNLSVTAGTLDMLAFTANRTAVGGVLSVANNATLKLSASNFPSNNYSTRTLGPTSTVNYYGAGAQTVSLQTYGHLILSGGGTKTPVAGATTIAGNFTLAAGVTYGGTTNNPTINLAGNFSNSGTFNSGSGIYTFNGTTTQTLTGATTFRNLTINKTAATPNNQVILNNDITIGTPTNGTLRFTNGVIVTGASKVIITSTGTVARTSGHVAGNLQKTVTTGANVSRTFEIGDATTYRPATLLFASVTGAGSVMAASSQTAGDHSVAGSGIDTTKSVNRYWTLTNVGTVFTTYSATFNFVAGDIDAGANTALFLVKRYAASAWSGTTTGTKTAPSTQATGLNGFGDFAIGQAGNLINNFLISIGSAAASTCVAKNVTITARDAANATLTAYTGTITLSTSTSHGDWYKGVTALSATDTGAALYTFTGAGAGMDNGVVVLSLSNTHADDLTINVQDTPAGVSSGPKGPLNFRDNAFVITPTDILGTTVVAGRPHTVKAELWRKDLSTGINCSIATNYAGNKSLKAWLTRDVSDPVGAAPKIGAQSLPNTQPAAGALNNNLTLSFTAGAATFSLLTSDVGKYALNLLDDSRVFASAVDILGGSSTLTTRPFGIGFTSILSGATPNQGGANPTEPMFTKAGQAFKATVGGYLWATGQDTLSAGTPDPSANITANGLTPSFAWPTTLAPVLNTPSVGITGTLGGTTSIAQASFSGGTYTVSDLTYSEVGSIKITASGTNFLNSGGVNFSGTSGIIGRFIPDHFATSTLMNGSLANGCGSFTYSGQQSGGRGAIRYLTAPQFTITAQSAANTTTANYTGTFSKLAASGITVTPPTKDFAQVGADLTNKVNLTANLAAGTLTDKGNGTFTYVLGNDDFAYTHEINSQVAPFTSDVHLDIAVIAEPAGADGVSTTIIGQTLTPTGVEIRFGRLNLQNAYGSELLPLPINLTAEYWAGTTIGFVTNTADILCTTVNASNVTVTPNVPLLAGDTTLTVASPTLVKGSWHTSAIGPYSQLSAPGAGKQGSVDLFIDLDAAGLGWLKYNWSGSVYGNPRARAVFGIYQGPERRIYLRER